MSELKDDSSDNDVFIISHIKPTKKKKLEKALIAKSALKFTRSAGNKKRENAIRLNSRPRRTKKQQSTIQIGNCLGEETLLMKMKCEQSKIPYSSQGNNISNSVLEIPCAKNKLKCTAGNLGENKMLFAEESRSEVLLETMSIKCLSNHLNAKPGKFYLDEKLKNNTYEAKKRTEISPPFSEKTKKLKSNLTTTPMPLTTNKLTRISLPEVSVGGLEGNCFMKKKSKSEENTSQCEVNLEFKSEDDNKLKFGEFAANEFSSEFEGLNSSNQEPEEKFKGNSELLSFLLRKIVSDEIKKQMEIKGKSCYKEKTVQHLLSEYEIEIFEKFLGLEDNACKLFVRMLIRKNDWHRVSTIKYNDINENLGKYFNILEKVNFIDVNIEDEDFYTQLNLLKKPEILKLSRALNICHKVQNVSKKDVLIKSLIQDCKKQRSILDIIRGSNPCSRINLLKSQLKKYLGMCVKINQNTFKAFNKIILLFSFTHYFDEEEKRLSNTLYLCFKTYKNIIKFPDYKLSPCVVFETKCDFEEYERSLRLLHIFEVAISNKNHDEFMAVVTDVKECFKNILEDYEYHKRFLSLPSFLQKFSAGTIYARILTKYCQVFKKKADDLDIIETVKLLLHQNLFLQRKRGDWYEILSKTLESQKKNKQAAEVIVKSLKDPLISEVQRLSLQLRGQGILKKKTFGITDLELKEALSEKCTSSLGEPSSIEIKGKALDGNESGFKCVYIQNMEGGKRYVSVEETAIFYYKSQGFSKGYHAEGSIIHLIYFIMFFDIIYGLSPKGVFQSPYQEAPLDFNSTSFYLNRKPEIDKLLADMPTWNDKKIETTIKDVYSRNFNTTCVVNWSNEFTPELLCEVIRCITMPVMVLIFQRLIHNFQVYRSGFPDLTLWNSETNEIKFVEVKSPNDRLSPAQRIWLSYLKFIGLNSEVCNVKNK